jgi:hypothetical protein
VVGVVALAFLGWVAWVVFEYAAPAVTSELVSFDVVDAHAVDATFTVSRRETGVAASCLLRAQAPDHSVVGELAVSVGPGGERLETLTRTLRTEREATAVEVVGCTAPGQHRPR